jgi:hypothetical protein
MPSWTRTGRESVDNSAYNLAILRQMTLNVMRRDRSPVALRSKFNLAAWKDGLLAELLSPI